MGLRPPPRPRPRKPQDLPLPHPRNHGHHDITMAPVLHLARKEGASFLFFGLLIGLTFLF